MYSILGFPFFFFFFFYREYIHQQNLGFYLCVPTLFKLSQHSSNFYPFLPYFCIIPGSHDKHAHPLLAPSLLTFFSPVLHFRWIYTGLLSSYNCHICAFGFHVICCSVHCTFVVRWEGVKNAEKCNCWFLFEKHSDVFNGAVLPQQITKQKTNMMHPCRNIFKRPFFAIKLFKKCDWISQACF